MRMLHAFTAHIILLLVLNLAAWHAVAAPLPAQVSNPLQAAGIPEQSVGIWVQAVDSDTPLLALNPNQAFNPASVMKLVTAFAALERFGPAHTLDTRVLYAGSREGNLLDGDLILVGGGDPMLSLERLWRLLRQVRLLGIHEIKGDIVLDGSALQLPPHDPNAFDGRGLRPYNSGPYGVLTHFNTLNLTLIPGAGADAPVTVLAGAPLAGVRIDNQISAAPGNCGVWYAQLDARSETTPDGLRVVLSGKLPSRCGRRDWSVAPLEPAAFAGALIAGLWQELGGTLQGQVREGRAPVNSVELLRDTSPAMADIVREMNKWSSNVIARQLLALLGSQERPSLDMVDAGRAATRNILLTAGIDADGLVIENGAGLSRIERITPAGLARMLQVAWHRPFMPEFISALPVAGVDGTARRRLNDSPARGHAHIKTGTINGVRAIAGYMLDHTARRHIVVMMVNHPKAAESRPAQDALLEWVWAQPN